jgi:hypothetical protein
MRIKEFIVYDPADDLREIAHLENDIRRGRSTCTLVELDLEKLRVFQKAQDVGGWGQRKIEKRYRTMLGAEAAREAMDSISQFRIRLPFRRTRS